MIILQMSQRHSRPILIFYKGLRCFSNNLAEQLDQSLKTVDSKFSNAPQELVGRVAASQKLISNFARIRNTKNFRESEELLSADRRTVISSEEFCYDRSRSGTDQERDQRF